MGRERECLGRGFSEWVCKQVLDIVLFQIL